MYTSCYDLPNGRVLLLSRGISKKEETILRVFSINDFSVFLSEKKIPGHFYFLCSHSQTDTFLLSGRWTDVVGKNGWYLLNMSAELDILSQPSIECNFASSEFLTDADEPTFFDIKPSEKKLRLTIYQQDHTKSYKPIVDHEFSELALPQFVTIFAEDILSFGKNRYCTLLCDGGHTGFGILFFEVNPENYAVKQLKMVAFEQPRRASMVKLPDGNIMIYDLADGDMQLWDSQTFQSVKTWRWSDIQTPYGFMPYNVRMEACPNPSHLFVKLPRKIFLLDLATSTLMPIEDQRIEEKERNNAFENHVLDNNKIVVFTSHTFNYGEIFHPSLVYLVDIPPQASPQPRRTTCTPG